MTTRDGAARYARTVVVYALLALFFLYPMARLLQSAATRNGAVSAANLVAVFTNRSNVDALVNSVMVGVVVTAISTTMALVLAWLVVRTDLYLRRFLRVFLVTPFFIPPFIMAFAWTRLLGRAGFLNTALQTWFNLDGPPIDIYGAGGVILVSVIYTYPYAFLVLSKSIENIGGHLEEAARVSGARPAKVVRDVVAPVLLPSVGSAAVIVFVTTISMFGIPAILGTPGQFIVVTTRIYGYVGGFRDPNGIGIATTLSLALLAIAGAALVVQGRFTRREDFVTITGKSAPVEPTQLGAARLPLTVVLVVFGLAVVAAPLAAVALTSVMPALGVPLSVGTMTAEHYGTVWGMSMVRRSLRNSFFLALSVPTVTAAAAVVLVWFRRREAIRWAKPVEHIVSLPYAVPGIVIGVAMILAWIRPIAGVSIYNTIWILVVAYIVRFMIFPMRTVDAAWKQIDPALEEAARVSGARRRRVLRDVSIPLLRSGIGAGWLLAFMPALTELTLSILLYSPRNETIGVTAFNIMQEGLIPPAAAYALSIAVIVLALHLGSELMADRRRGGGAVR